MKWLYFLLPLTVVLFSGCENHDHDHDHDDHGAVRHDHNHDHDDHDAHDHDHESPRPENKVEEPGVVFYPKERQNKAVFALEQATVQTLKISVPAFGSVLSPGDRTQLLSAPVSGLIAPAENIRVGSMVKQGQILAYIHPILGQKEDAATLRFELERARIALESAQTELARTEVLKAQNAASQKQITESEQNHKLAQAQLATIQQRLDQMQGKTAKDGAVTVRSALDGRIISQRALPGEFVQEGAPILTVSDGSKLWIQANLSARDRVRMPDFGAIEAVLDEVPLYYRIGENARVVSAGETIDPQTLTVPVVFEIENDPVRLLPGQTLPVRVYDTHQRACVAIPKSAIIDDNGVKIIYVQEEEDHFERREIETGLQDGPWVEVLSGIAEGERVVSRGAYRILLSSLAPAEIGHGHAH
ncbi:MAG: efflux RND transporter periplasmic adaptor subunit [Campylobacterales bacterium]